MDFNKVDSVGIQISADGQQVWVCIDGECKLRVKGIKYVGIQVMETNQKKEED